MRYRVIATVWVDGILLEASTVMEMYYVSTHSSLSSKGGGTRLYGEALIFDMPGGRTFYILPDEHIHQYDLVQFWEEGLLKTLGVKNSVGGLSADDFKKIRAASGRMPIRFFGRLPTFVAFGDEQQPTTIFEIENHRLSQVFPGVIFKSLELEITAEPLTKKLRKRLPWLNIQKQVFDRDPPGKSRSIRVKPLTHLITRNNFFGSGSK